MRPGGSRSTRQFFRTSINYRRSKVFILAQNPNSLHNLGMAEKKKVTKNRKLVPSQQRTLHIALLITSILLAIIGQVQLLKQHLIAGGIFYTLALVAFCFATWQNPPAEMAIGEPARRKIVAPPILLLTSFMVSFVVCDMVRTNAQFPSSAIVIPIGWSLSILLFAIGILHGCGWRFPLWRKIVESVKSKWVEIANLLLILVLAFTVRFILISTHPYAFANDEGLIAVEAMRLQTNEFGSIFTTASAAMPMLNFLPTLISVDIFGRSFAAIRLVSVLEGVLTVLFLYLAAKEAFGKRVAFIAAAILAFLPVHIHFSRAGFTTIIFGFYPVLLIWLVLRAVRTGRMSSYLLAGLATACAFFTHMGAWLSIGFAVGIIGYFCIFRKGYLRQNWAHLLVFLGGMVMVIAPQVVFFIKHPDSFAARYNGVGVFQSGWLAAQVAETGKSAAVLLGEQFLKSTLAFISINTPAGFYNTPRPYFMPLSAIFLVLGMGYTIMRIRRPAYLFLFAWFWSVIVLGGMLTTDAPASHRLVMALPAAAIFVGIGLDQVAMAAARLRLIPRRIGSLLIGLAVLVAALDGVRFYFVDYRTHNWYGDHSNEVEFESIRILQQLGVDYEFVLLGRPEVTIEFPNYVFFLKEYNKMDVPYGDTFPAAAASGKTFFVAIPSRKAELETIAQSLPGGTWLDLQRRWASNEPLFSAYIVPAAPVVLYSAHARPPDNPSREFRPAPWMWWLAVILASIVLDLYLLPLIWRRVVKKEKAPPRGPWVWLTKLGKKLQWWLEG
jgi:4-amino-4-deoxy-L-arabinose transferase-like glycosyltransferase